MDFDPLDQKLQCPGLFGGEQFVPQRVQTLQRFSNIGLIEPVTLVAGGPPGCDDHLRRSQNATHLIDHCCFDLGGRHTAK